VPAGAAPMAAAGPGFSAYAAPPAFAVPPAPGILPAPGIPPAPAAAPAADLVPGPVVPARALLTLGQAEFVLAVSWPRPRLVAPGWLVPGRLPQCPPQHPPRRGGPVGDAVVARGGGPPRIPGRAG